MNLQDIAASIFDDLSTMIARSDARLSFQGHLTKVAKNKNAIFLCNVIMTTRQVMYLLTKVAGMAARRQAAVTEAIATVTTVKIVLVGLVAVMAGVDVELAEKHAWSSKSEQ